MDLGDMLLYSTLINEGIRRVKNGETESEIDSWLMACFMEGRERQYIMDSIYKIIKK